MNGFIRRMKELSSRSIVVCADGYAKSWNIVSERSKADDRGLIEAIIRKFATYGNVQKDNFTIMGNLVGAALVNQMMIETRLPNTRNYISSVSPLNAFQHDGKNFKGKGGVTPIESAPQGRAVGNLQLPGRRCRSLQGQRRRARCASRDQRGDSAEIHRGLKRRSNVAASVSKQAWGGEVLLAHARCCIADATVTLNVLQAQSVVVDRGGRCEGLIGKEIEGFLVRDDR